MNKYLHFGTDSEQYLMQSLIDESIDIFGSEFYYIPRKLVMLDEVLGEDRLSEFKQAYPFTAYLENTQGLEGQGAFIERYGALLDYGASLLVSRRSWDKFVGSRMNDTGSAMLPNRPCAGDLIYYPLTDGLFEIKYVNDKEPFAQAGAFYTWRLNISLFQYSSEKIETGIDDIDAFESLKTFDTVNDRSFWGGVRRVEILDGGLGYSSDNISFYVESRSGTDALFEPVIDSNGTIRELKIVDGGMNYSENDTVVNVLGPCEIEAQIRCECGTQIELAGDKWGSNTALGEYAEKTVEGFNTDNTFNEAEPLRTDVNTEQEEEGEFDPNDPFNEHF